MLAGVHILACRSVTPASATVNVLLRCPHKINAVIDSWKRNVKDWEQSGLVGVMDPINLNIKVRKRYTGPIHRFTQTLPAPECPLTSDPP